MCVHWDGPDPETKAIDDDVNMQNEYSSNIVLDGLRADHQGSQPGTPTGTGMNMGGFGDGPHIGDFLLLKVACDYTSCP
jgi:hypothetical protein